MDPQALVPVCRGTSLSSGWADSFVASPQSCPSAWQALSFPDHHGTTDRREVFACYDAPPSTPAPPNLDSIDGAVSHDLVEPNQTGEGILDPALVAKLRLDVGEQYIIEHRLLGEDWDTITHGFQQRFGISSSSSRSALTMRLYRLKKKHPEIRLLFESASSKKGSGRRKGQGHHQKTGRQGRNIPAEETIMAEHEEYSEQMRREGRGKPWSRPPKTFDRGTKHCSTQSKAAAAADLLLAFLGQPEMRGLMAREDYKSVVRVRSRLRE